MLTVGPVKSTLVLDHLLGWNQLAIRMVGGHGDVGAHKAWIGRRNLLNCDLGCLLACPVQHGLHSAIVGALVLAVCLAAVLDADLLLFVLDLLLHNVALLFLDFLIVLLRVG